MYWYAQPHVAVIGKWMNLLRNTLLVYRVVHNLIKRCPSFW